MDTKAEVVRLAATWITISAGQAILDAIGKPHFARLLHLLKMMMCVILALQLVTAIVSDIAAFFSPMMNFFEKVTGEDGETWWRRFLDIMTRYPKEGR